MWNHHLMLSAYRPVEPPSGDWATVHVFIVYGVIREKTAAIRGDQRCAR
eukprot:COSAG02_NODE_99_length_37069_cov_24.910957_18_plen_49_part_00